MSIQLNFSKNFAHQMTIISILIGMAISLMTPVTYGIMAWYDFKQIAIRYAEGTARRAGQTALDNPEFWYYSVPKFLEFVSEPNYSQKIKSIKSYDKNSNLKFEYLINKDIKLTHTFRTPVKYGTEIYGFIEIEQSIQSLCTTIATLTFFFTVGGISIGIFLYRFPVKIINLAEENVYSHMDQTRKQTELEVARLDRLGLIGQMAAAIGHEIRNPLTTVRGYLQFFSRKPIFSPFISQFDLMLDELNRANNIITEFLALSHEKAINMSSCNLNHIIEAFQPLIESDALLHGLSINVDLKTLPDLLLDEKEIKQLLLNVTRNGFEAMEGGGCLSIQTYVDAPFIVLAVIDQGKGIAPHLIEKLGTPFFTTKDNGTGLGLAVCYSIAHRHGAKIHFRTSTEGTTCAIYFPQSC